MMLAVRRTARAIGWMNRLMVSMMTSIGIRGVGVPCGSRWARAFLVLERKPVVTAPAHRGMAMARFIDSWVVGVNEWGKSPRRLVVAIKIINDINIRDQVRPLALCIVIICFEVSWISHCWVAISRLLMRYLEVGISRGGSRIINTAAGKPRIVGAMNEANKFSFILVLRVYRSFLFLWFLVRGVGGNLCLKLLVG